MERIVSLDHYDRILIAIGLSLCGGAVAGVATAVQFRVGLLAGSLVATVFVYEAMFRNPPLPEQSARAKAAAVLWHVFVAYLLLTVL